MLEIDYELKCEDNQLFDASPIVFRVLCSFLAGVQRLNFEYSE